MAVVDKYRSLSFAFVKIKLKKESGESIFQNFYRIIDVGGNFILQPLRKVVLSVLLPTNLLLITQTLVADCPIFHFVEGIRLRLTPTYPSTFDYFVNFLFFGV